MTKTKPVAGAAGESPWKDRARLLAAMAHPVRLVILEALCERPRCVKDVNALVPLAQAHLSQRTPHLRQGAQTAPAVFTAEGRSSGYAGRGPEQIRQIR